MCNRSVTYRATSLAVFRFLQTRPICSAEVANFGVLLMVFAETVELIFLLSLT